MLGGRGRSRKLATRSGRLKRYAPLAVAGLCLVGASGASAVAVDRYYYMQKGDRAEFVTPAHWSCLNHGSVVTCSSGDAFPFVDLLMARPGGITVKVHTLAGSQSGRLVKTVDRYGRPVWTFSAL